MVVVAGPLDPRWAGRGRGRSRATAEADDRVLAAQADPAQDIPDVTDDGQVLARLCVGDLDTMSVNTLVGQIVPDRLRGMASVG